MIFRISRCTPFLLRQASGSSSWVLLGSSVVNFPKSDFAADGGSKIFYPMVGAGEDVSSSARLQDIGAPGVVGGEFSEIRLRC